MKRRHTDFSAARHACINALTVLALLAALTLLAEMASHKHPPVDSGPPPTQQLSGDS